VGTGLRFGEIAALMVKDLALEATSPTLTLRWAGKRTGTRRVRQRPGPVLPGQAQDPGVSAAYRPLPHGGGDPARVGGRRGIGFGGSPCVDVRQVALTPSEDPSRGPAGVCASSQQPHLRATWSATDARRVRNTASARCPHSRARRLQCQYPRLCSGTTRSS
jgi:hypothetical protein